MPEFEYFLKIRPPEYPVERPQCLWRRSGDAWEYLSLIDWSWRRLDERKARLPEAGQLVPVDADRAEQLATDRQFWVRYWAVESDPPPYGSGQPYTVVRIRSDPHGDHEEAFGRENTWIRSTIMSQVYHGDLEPIREIDRDEAETILQRIRGVTGATEL